MRLRRIQPTGKLVYGVAGTLVLLFGGQAAALAGAGGGGSPIHARGGESSAEIAGGSTTGGCGMAYDTESSTNIPPDDTTSDNVAAATASLHKTCPGSVIARFVSEASTPASGDFIHIDMRATCTATGGLSTPCTVGQTVFGSPGHTFMQNGPANYGTASATFVFAGLRRGNWKFEVLPGGNNVANLQFRTFVVEAFAGAAS